MCQSEKLNIWKWRQENNLSAKHQIFSVHFIVRLYSIHFPIFISLIPPPIRVFLFHIQISNSTTMQIDTTVQTTPPPQPPPPPQDPTPNRPKSNPRKRKKDVNSRSPEEKQAQIEALEKEFEGLFAYYRGVLAQKVVIDLKQCGGSRNVVVAALMEESELPLSKLVDEIYEKLNCEVANGGIVLAEGVNSALVKSSLLFVGQRMMYGVPNADADILEDHSDPSLWCWEVILIFFS